MSDIELKLVSAGDVRLFDRVADDEVFDEAVDAARLAAYLSAPGHHMIVALDAGTGRIELHVPVVNLRPGLFLVDVVIERPPVVFDHRYRCDTLHVLPGNQPVAGDLLMPSETRVLRSPDDSGAAAAT